MDTVIAALVLSSAVRWLTPQGDNEDLMPFALHFEWGPCEERGERGMLDIDADGQLQLLLLAADQRTGRERTATLGQEEMQALADALMQSTFWELPVQIVPPEGAIVLSPGCSHLDIALDQHAAAIDEADGTNAAYFQLKTYLVNLALSQV